ncbi:MAG TPA: CPBP family intramembrane glutamic endopeptidase, partial [Usitatibacter sp.]|nr:CPBP family intramembrane glutamic endopeptidase [Usitatibacter sp.]
MDRADREFARRFAIALAAELVFLAGRTWIVNAIETGVAQELAWSAWRVPFIALYAWLARPFLFPKEERRPMPSHPLLWFATLLVLADIPVMAATGTAEYRLTLALTAFLPALREELLFRVITQGFLERLVGPVASIVATSVLFVAYHYGAQPLGLLNVAGIFAAGVVLGAIYQRTRSLAVVTALHTAIDVLFALAPRSDFAP